MVGHFFYAKVGDVGHKDALLRGGLDVDILIADAAPHDDLAFGHLFDDGSAQGYVPGQDGICIVRGQDQLLLVSAAGPEQVGADGAQRSPLGPICWRRHSQRFALRPGPQHGLYHKMFGYQG